MPLFNSTSNFCDASELNNSDLHNLVSKQLVSKEDIFKLLKSGADLEATNRLGNTPFLEAIRVGNFENAISLLELGANRQAQNNDGNNALHLIFASYDPVKNFQYGYSTKLTEIVSQFIDQEVEINHLNRDGLAPLTLAIDKLLCQPASLLIDKDADLRVTGPKEEPLLNLIFNKYYGYLNAQISSTKDTKLSDIENLAVKIIAKGVDLNHEYQKGTPLYWAIYFGLKTAAIELIKAGANINAQTEQGATALHLAVIGGKKDIVAALLDTGAVTDIQSLNGKTPLLVSFDFRVSDITELLLEHGSSLSIVDNNDNSPLGINANSTSHLLPYLPIGDANDELASKYSVTIVNKLRINDSLLCDELVSVMNQALKWHIFYAMRDNNQDYLQQLYNYQFDANLGDYAENSLLHIATQQGKNRAVEFLLKYGARVNAFNSYQQTPLDLAKLYNYPQISQLLEQADAKNSDQLEHIHTLLRDDNVIRYNHRWWPNEEGKVVIKYSYAPYRELSQVEQEFQAYGARINFGLIFPGVSGISDIAKGLTDINSTFEDSYKQLMQQAFMHYSNYLDIHFEETSELKEANLGFIKMQNKNKNLGGVALTISHGVKSKAAILMLPESGYMRGAEFLGSIIHELGHILGLNHPADMFHHSRTIMSYTHMPAVSLFPQDIEALLAKYPSVTGVAENNLYKLSVAEEKQNLFGTTIFDMGGIDTIDLSELSDCDIDMMPGEVSECIHYGFAIAHNTQIENLICSTGDCEVEDNDANNYIDLSLSEEFILRLYHLGNDTIKLNEAGGSIYLRENTGHKTLIGFTPENHMLYAFGVKLSDYPQFTPTASLEPIELYGTIIYFQNEE